MVRIAVRNSLTEKKQDGGIAVVSYIEATGLSSDNKPVTAISNGSIFVEVDTGTVFFFDEAGAQWVEQFSFQG